MTVRSEAQTTNMIFAWAGALIGLVYELRHPLFMRAWLAHPLELLVLLMMTLAILTKVNKPETPGVLMHAMCAALGLLFASATFLLVTG